MVEESGHGSSRFLGHLLIQMYGKCGCVDGARRAFAGIRDSNLISWNLLIVAFLENGKFESAEELFDRRPQLSVVSYNTMISAYARNGHINKAKLMFDSMPEKDVISWNTMITAYSQNRDLASARTLFCAMKNKDLVSWNSMLAAYAQGGHYMDAVKTFHTMELEGWRPNHVTILCFLSACGQSKLVAKGRRMHLRAGELLAETKVGNALIDMYGKCAAIREAKAVFDSMPNRDVVSWTTLLVAYAAAGDLLNARRVFDSMPGKNIVSWNSMISSYADAGCLSQVLEIFHIMLKSDVEPDEGTFITVIDACANAGALEEGESVQKIFIHQQKQRLVNNGQRSTESQLLVDGQRQLPVKVGNDGPHAIEGQFPVKVGNTLLSLYTKCDRMDSAMDLFDRMPVRNVITWTTIISANAQKGHCNEALETFHRMDLEGIKPNEVTFVSALDACVAATSLGAARRLHRRSLDTGVISAAEPKVGNAIINAYGKCGRIDLAEAAFRDIRRKNRITWNALLAAYAHGGRCRETLDLAAAMAVEGIDPDYITFTSAISICAQAGLRRKCRELFLAVRSDHGIDHDVAHYVCMVDLLGKMGYLDEAEELIETMPFEDDAAGGGADPQAPGLRRECGCAGD